jgi:hypothetical protein
MVGCLIVSLALIVFLVILQKKLPDGSKSHFNIPLQRDIEHPVLDDKPVRRQGYVLKGNLPLTLLV